MRTLALSAMASALRAIPTRVILEEIQRRVFCIDKEEKRVILVGEHVVARACTPCIIHVRCTGTSSIAR